MSREGGALLDEERNSVRKRLGASVRLFEKALVEVAALCGPVNQRPPDPARERDLENQRQG